VGLESGAASGWPGTDWIENILLRQAGPEVYDRWHRGEVLWSSPEIKQAWQSWGQIVARPEMVHGGKQGMLTTNFQIAGNPLFSRPPGCYMHHQASFMTNLFLAANPDLHPGEDFDFFRFPDVNPKYSGAIEGAGDLFGIFRDTPQSRALISYLATPEAQGIWVKRGGALSANRRVLPDVYPNQLSRQLAQTLTGAETVRFDASDLMPDAMNDAFWKAVLEYVGNPGDLDGILARLDAVRAQAYRE
jgi:alpha-glucoside transport system substrate-binding protein